jgi:hypothetical protein
VVVLPAPFGPSSPITWPGGTLSVTSFTAVNLSRSETRFRAVSWRFAAGHRRGWDYLEVLLSLLYRLVRCLLGLLAVLVRSDLSKDVELLVLRQENQVLRRQAGGPAAVG